MPKISELPEVTETNSSGYVVGVQDNTAVKYPLNLIGSGGSSGVSSGTSIYTGTEPPNNPIDGQLWIDESQGVQDQTNYLDVSNYTIDYYLRRGETAIVNYSASTSVPLHIKTVEGMYEVIIHGDKSITPSTGRVVLKANNTNYSGAVYQSTRYGTGTNTDSYWQGTFDNFWVAEGRCDLAKLEISTITKTKASLVQSTGYTTFRAPVIGNSSWEDTTTAWTSLGTITFPFAQSGTILIRRIY